LRSNGKKVILVDGRFCARADAYAVQPSQKKTALRFPAPGPARPKTSSKKTVHRQPVRHHGPANTAEPAELIGGARFGQLVTTLRAMADYVIFDSPALLPVRTA